MIKSPLTSGLKPDESPGPIPRIGSAKSWRARLSRAKEMGELHRGTSGLRVGGWINCSTFFLKHFVFKGGSDPFRSYFGQKGTRFFRKQKAL